MMAMKLLEMLRGPQQQQEAVGMQQQELAMRQQALEQQAAQQEQDMAMRMAAQSQASQFQQEDFDWRKQRGAQDDLFRMKDYVAKELQQQLANRYQGEDMGLRREQMQHQLAQDTYMRSKEEERQKLLQHQGVLEALTSVSRNQGTGEADPRMVLEYLRSMGVQVPQAPLPQLDRFSQLQQSMQQPTR